MAIHPLTDNEIIPTLLSVLENTAKDLWRAERDNISSWADFKDAFPHAFLSEDHDLEAERRIRDRVQRVDEPIPSAVSQMAATDGREGDRVGTLIEKDLQAAKEYRQKQPSNPTHRKEKVKSGPTGRQANI